jgi:hypothetical protein
MTRWELYLIMNRKPEKLRLERDDQFQELWVGTKRCKMPSTKMKRPVN